MCGGGEIHSRWWTSKLPLNCRVFLFFRLPNVYATPTSSDQKLININFSFFFCFCYNTSYFSMSICLMPIYVAIYNNKHNISLTYFPWRSTTSTQRPAIIECWNNFFYQFLDFDSLADGVWRVRRNYFNFSVRKTSRLSLPLRVHVNDVGSGHDRSININF